MLITAPRTSPINFLSISSPFNHSSACYRESVLTRGKGFRAREQMMTFHDFFERLPCPPKQMTVPPVTAPVVPAVVVVTEEYRKERACPPIRSRSFLSPGAMGHDHGYTPEFRISAGASSRLALMTRAVVEASQGQAHLFHFFANFNRCHSFTRAFHPHSKIEEPTP